MNKQIHILSAKKINFNIKINNHLLDFNRINMNKIYPNKVIDSETNAFTTNKADNIVKQKSIHKNRIASIKVLRKRFFSRINTHNYTRFVKIELHDTLIYNLDKFENEFK